MRVADGHIDVPNSGFLSLRRHLEVMPDLVSAVDGASVRDSCLLFFLALWSVNEVPQPMHKAPHTSPSLVRTTN